MMKLTVIFCIRSAYILISMVVTYSLILQSWGQFISKSTSILTEVTEPKKDFYPSITICTGPKEGDPNVFKLLQYEQENNNMTHISTSDISKLIAKYNFSYTREQAVPGLFQVYAEDGPSCYRGDKATTNLAQNTSLWSTSIPHPHLSGLCYTYDPTKESTPGNCYSIRIGLGNSYIETNTKLLETIQVFLHPPGKFIYFKEQDQMPDNLHIGMLSMKKDMANIFTLKKTIFSSLSRPYDDRPCVDDVLYDWGNCLDKMFYASKGCQDPWYVNTDVSLSTCSNVTQILGSYNDGPAASGWDGRFWDKPYMAQRELTELVRDGLSCPPPCHTLSYQTEVVYMPRTSTDTYEFGDPDWKFAIKLIYKNLVQEKKAEYRICQFSCLLSNFGGTVGIFFGVSFLDIIYVWEWGVTAFLALFKRGPARKK